MWPAARNKIIRFYQIPSPKLNGRMPKLLPMFAFFRLRAKNFSRTKEAAVGSLLLIWKTIPHGRERGGAGNRGPEPREPCEHGFQQHGIVPRQGRAEMNTAQGFGQRVADYRPTKGLLFWAAAAGAVATIVIGFAWGGWVTGGSAKRMAEAAAASARDTLVAAVCVDRFQAGGDAQAQLAALKLLQGYDRGSFIEKGGWATIPDKAKPTSAAARLCGDQLVAL